MTLLQRCTTGQPRSTTDSQVVDGQRVTADCSLFTSHVATFAGHIYRIGYPYL